MSAHLAEWYGTLQCSVYIAFDPEMREGPEGEGARARNSDIVEDLGMVEYVFSDKTGTLTSNEMQLRMLCIMSVPFGSIDYRCMMLEAPLSA